MTCVLIGYRSIELDIMNKTVSCISSKINSIQRYIEPIYLEEIMTLTVDSC